MDRQDFAERLAALIDSAREGGVADDEILASLECAGRALEDQQ